ncbi:MAG: ATP-binding cassette domain-containing protein, partial [Burkholderiales bacterium]
MTTPPDRAGRISGYGEGATDAVLSVDEIERAAGELAGDGPDTAVLAALCGAEPLVAIDGLVAGYGKMQVLHGVDLRVGRGQSLCLFGPNGAGKSTVLHAIHGFARVMSGTIKVDGRDVTTLSSHRKLAEAGVAYILQDNSVFPDM